MLTLSHWTCSTDRPSIQPIPEAFTISVSCTGDNTCTESSVVNELGVIGVGDVGVGVPGLVTTGAQRGDGDLPLLVLGRVRDTDEVVLSSFSSFSSLTEIPVL